jgi:hypothetical protein
MNIKEGAMVIYFTLDSEGRLEGVSSHPSNVDGEISMNIREDHEVLKNPFIFRYENGELVKDVKFQLQQLKISKLNELNQACEYHILNGFKHKIREEIYHFSYDKEAQLNLRDTKELFDTDIITEHTLTAKKNGECVRVTVNKEEFNNLYVVSVKHKNECISKFRDQLVPMVRSAATIEDIMNISWHSI